MRLSVVIPVYNAAGFVEESLGALAAFLDAHCPDHELIAVDDGSTDGSLAALRRLEAERVRVVSCTENRGKFAAIREGMRVARGACKVFTDADVPFEHEAIPYIEQLVNERGFHVVIADRTLPDSVCGVTSSFGTSPQVRNEDVTPRLPWGRRVTTRLFRHAVRLLVTGGLPDSQAGLKGFQADAADALFPLLTDTRFGGDIELLYIALKHNLAIRRIPVRLVRQGASSVRPLRHGWRMLRTLARLRRNWRRGLYRSDALSALAAQRYWETPHSAE